MRFKAGFDVSDRRFDVVIVGAGIAGSVLAKALAKPGRRILVLEAGTGPASDYSGYLGYLDNYYSASAKATNAPYPNNANAQQPDVLNVSSNDAAANSQGYLVQKGRLPFKSDYTRSAGGTTLHWLGTCLRMLPDDFEIRRRYGVGLDWPIGYDDLKPYYAKAEQEIGVSADIEDQLQLQHELRLNGWFDADYVFPMHKIPQSHVDQFFAKGTQDLAVDYGGELYPVRVTSTPQGRNGMPNARYPGGYTPVGAVGNPNLGQRCQGNSSCVPICPVQAKYNALKSLSAAFDKGGVDGVEIVTQAVASRINVDANGRVSEIEYKVYADPNSRAYDVFVARGAIFVLAANPVENVKLLLGSRLGGEATGRYLMDHPVLLTWGLADQRLGTFRGPGSSSGIESLRGGAFRSERSPFRVEIDNWGWNWATGAPWSSVQSLVYGDPPAFGHSLREGLFDTVQRQVRLGFLLEVPPLPENRISIDPAYMDRIDNYRPVITYDLPDYVKAGFAAAKQTSDIIFDRLGVKDHTSYAPTDAGYVTYEGRGYTYQGAGHYIGGHIMGADPRESVVGADQRAWGHENLWLVGCGNMPTEGTSNPTLTMTALTLMAADLIETQLSGRATP